MLPITEAQTTGGYRLVVMDPPWENRSISRSGNYGTLAPDQIARLPVKSLLSPQGISPLLMPRSSSPSTFMLPDPGAYVVVWVTNNPAIHNFVKHNLFPRWRTQYVATHYWLKVPLLWPAC